MVETPVEHGQGAPHAGQRIGPVEFRPTLLRLVMYAGAMWEFQRIHFDHEWALREGLEAPIVHGPLLGTYLSQVVRDWGGPGAQLRRLRWRNTNVAVVDRVVTVEGTVTGVESQADGGWLCDGDVWIRAADGARILSGQATVHVGGR
jgi:hydroxyacyl-ACP dehydratase HTD2-like protein with hotdog domain